jgi:exodeoxyribonuclease VII large subunit
MKKILQFDAAQRVIGVADLNRLAKELVETNLPLMWVAGEISNFVRAASGHCYFSLKDAHAQVRCVMFRHKMQMQDWTPENGMQVEVRAYPSFYEARGEFQLNAEAMRRSGLGALYAAFEKLKAKLQAEGLFDEAARQPLPRFPRAVGVVTSLKAAALRDVLTTLKTRMPSIPVVIYPTAVQGEGAAREIAAAIAAADARAECDVLIVCRGGGSIEDLWAFNEEVVARAIHACSLPVISGVGHETDFTIADFVADMRAPTPTAAAQLASANREALFQEMTHYTQRLRRVVERALERRMQQLDVLARSLVHPGERIAAQSGHLAHFASRLESAWGRGADDRNWRLRGLYQELRSARPDIELLATAPRSLAQRLCTTAANRLQGLRADLKQFAAQLANLNPDAVLERGYSITESADGSIVRDASQLKVDDDVRITFARGWARARIKDKGQGEGGAGR